MGAPLLLDTHILLWYLQGNERLSKGQRRRIDYSETVFYSIASVWEIGIKMSLGKLAVTGTLQEMNRVLKQTGLSCLQIEFGDVNLLAQLPFHHKDPFDRMLIAQAIRQNLSLMSVDSVFEKYDVTMLRR